MADEKKKKKKHSFWEHVRDAAGDVGGELKDIPSHIANDLNPNFSHSGDTNPITGMPKAGIIPRMAAGATGHTPSTQGQQPGAAGADPAPAAPPQVPTQGPQFSEANLQAYLKDFVQPILNERTQATQAEWGNIAQQMGKYGGNKFPGFEGMKATATDMVRDSMISAMMGPYLKEANTQMAGAFQQGTAAMASGNSIAPLIQAALQDPRIAAMYGATQGGGNLMGSAVGNIMGNTGVKSLFPQQSQTGLPNNQ